MSLCFFSRVSSPQIMVFPCVIGPRGSCDAVLMQLFSSCKSGYCRVKNGELWMVNVNISPYDNSSAYFNHEAVRDRKLLLHKKDIRKLRQKVDEKGLTIIATRYSINPHHRGGTDSHTNVANPPTTLC